MGHLGMRHEPAQACQVTRGLGADPRLSPLPSWFSSRGTSCPHNRVPSPQPVQGLIPRTPLSRPVHGLTPGCPLSLASPCTDPRLSPLPASPGADPRLPALPVCPVPPCRAVPGRAEPARLHSLLHDVDLMTPAVLVLDAELQPARLDGHAVARVLRDTAPSAAPARP